MKNQIMVIDGNSLMYRAFYAIPPYKNEQGLYTNAVYGFLNMLIKAISDYNPSHIAVAFDVYGKTFRHDFYEDYKAGRKETPEELKPQFGLVKKVLSSMNIKILESPGNEADDLLGTLSKIADDNDFESLLISGDKDIFQLISKKTKVLMTKRGLSDIDTYDEDKLFERYTIKPSQIIELKSLMGDASDNIPGVKGVGEKTAIKLLTEYSNLEKLYENIDEIKGKLKEKLVNDKDNAFMSRKLATIKRDIEIDKDFNNYTLLPYEETEVIDTLEELNFTNILSKIRKIIGQEIGSKFETPDIVQITDEIQLKELSATLKDVKKLSIYRDINNLYISDFKKEYTFSLIIDLLGNGFDIIHVLKLLKTSFENADEIIVYDKKDWLKLFENAGFNDDLNIFDTNLAAYVLNKNIKRGYDYVIESQLHSEHNGAPAFIMFELEKAQKKAIKIRHLDQLYYEIELPLSNVIYSIEKEGFKVSTEVLNAMNSDIVGKIESLKEKIFSLTGTNFNINSPKQLGAILFETLGLDVIKKTKTGYSTDSYVLDQLYNKHEIIPLIIDYRHLSKLKSTYIDGLLQIIDRRTNKLHTKLHQTGAITGRLSSSEPNLQNIPIRTKQGREIRKAFLPKEDNHILVSADYSQIELRVLSHIANEDNMINAFKNNLDIHRQTASQVYDVSYDEVTSDMRSSAKAVNFGIVYGISDFGLARQLNITNKKAGEFINKYFNEFPGIKKYMDNTIAYGKENGFVKTLYNRRIYLPELKSSNYNRRSASERVAMNAPIQGSAADIIKLAMIEVFNRLEYNNLKSKMILQVHDELIIDTLKSESEQVKKILIEEMENIIDLKCPLIVNVSWGSNWYEAK